MWQWIPSETKSHAACPHNNDRSATYFCKAGPSEWETLDISACKSTVSGKVDNFKQVGWLFFKNFRSESHAQSKMSVFQRNCLTSAL